MIDWGLNLEICPLTLLASERVYNHRSVVCIGLFVCQQQSQSAIELLPAKAARSFLKPNTKLASNPLDRQEGYSRAVRVVWQAGHLRWRERAVPSATCDKNLVEILWRNGFFQSVLLVHFGGQRHSQTNRKNKVIGQQRPERESLLEWLWVAWSSIAHSIMSMSRPYHLFGICVYFRVDYFQLLASSSLLTKSKHAIS